MTKEARDICSDFVARAVVASLFALLSINLVADFAHTHRATGLLLLVSESLVVVLTIFRRRARLVDRSADAAIATAISLVGPSLVRVSDASSLLPDLATTAISAVGLIVVISGKLTLGRSFGIAPANRGVVVAGPYGFVRHPIYTGYLVTHIAFACAYPSPWNMAVLVVSDIALIFRALCEERVLARDQVYQTYCRRVAWHLVPGVF